MVAIQTTYTKHVLHIGPNYKKRKGGIASVLKLYEQELNGFSFFPSAYFQNKYLNFLCLPLVWVLFIFRLLTEGKNIQIVHIHGASNGSFYRKYVFFLLAKLFHKKVVYHLHGGKFHEFYKTAPAWVKKRIEQVMNQADCILVLSEERKAFIEKIVGATSVNVLCNMVEEHPAIERTINFPIKGVFLGKISSEKGIDDLLAAVIQHRDVFEGKLNLIIGGNGNVKQLQRAIEENNLSSIIHYAGWVTGEKKQALLANCHFMFLPSYYEGLPISLLEGMSYSMPLIATNVGGIPQILEDGKNGISLTPGNIEQLADALNFYINNPEKITAHGEASHQKAQHFFPRKIIRQLDNIYAKVI